MLRKQKLPSNCLAYRCKRVIQTIKWKFFAWPCSDTGALDIAATDGGFLNFMLCNNHLAVDDSRRPDLAPLVLPKQLGQNTKVISAFSDHFVTFIIAWVQSRHAHIRTQQPRQTSANMYKQWTHTPWRYRWKVHINPHPHLLTHLPSQPKKRFRKRKQRDQWIIGKQRAQELELPEIVKVLLWQPKVCNRK